MKKVYFLLLILLIGFVIGCDKECTEHIDLDKDNICDDCKVELELCVRHIDDNEDNICDKCEKEIVCVEHIDENSDTLCDLCGEEIEKEEELYEFDFEKYNEEFNDRRSYLLDYLTSSTNNTSSAKTGFGLSAVKISLYEETGDETYLTNALTQADKCYDDFGRNQNCFSVFAAVYHYVKYNKYYSEELKAKAKNLIINTTVYSKQPDTPNHAFMFAVATYLANQEFGDEIHTEFYGYVDSKYPVDKDPTAEKTVKQILESYITSGEYECNSDTYMVSHIQPLLALRECATDEEVSKKADMLVHNIILSLAPVWLEGHISVARDRCYEPYASQNTGGCLITLLWYYFGGRSVYPTTNQLNVSESTMIGFAIASDFRPYWISYAMSSDREEVYTHYELHEYDYYNYNDDSNITYYSYIQSYMHQEYSVYSSVWTCEDVSITEGDRFCELDRRYRGFDRNMWGVDWTCEDPNQKSNFSIMNWDKTFVDSHIQIGATIYSEVLQNNGTVIGVFDLPEEYVDFADNAWPLEYQYPRNLTINMPTNYEAIIDEAYLGKMYVHYGTFMIAFKLSLPFVYAGEEQTHTNDVTKAYFVCEVVDCDDVDGETPEEELLYLQSMLEGNFRNIEYDTTGATKITYSALDGTKMSLQYGGSGKYAQSYINDEQIIYKPEEWPSQKNPWCNVIYGSKEITYTYKNNSITLDFNKLEIKESSKEDN